MNKKVIATIIVVVLLFLTLGRLKEGSIPFFELALIIIPLFYLIYSRQKKSGE